MSSNDLRIQILLNAVDKATAPFKSLSKQVQQASQKIKASQDALKELNKTTKQIEGFKKLQSELSQTANKMQSAREKVRELRQQMQQVAQPTEAMRRALEQAQQAASKLRNKHNELTQEQKKASNALRDLGVNTNRLSDHERELQQRVNRTTSELEQQRKAAERLAQQQERLSRAKSNYDRTMEVRNQLAGTGAGMVATGTAMTLPVAGVIKSYSRMEDAMKGVAKQVNGLIDENGNRTAKYTELQNEIKNISEQLPSENGAIDLASLVEGGARMGIINEDDPWADQKRDLLAFASTASKAATAFDLPADQLAEGLGKIAALYKVPIKDIEQLGNAINYLDDNAMSKGGDIIDVLQRMGGVADKLNYRNAAALGSTFLSLGAAPEIAASASNAMVRELSIATMQSKRFTDGLDILGINDKQLERDMAKDAMGTIKKVMQQINKLPADERLTMHTRLFGKEFGDDSAKLANNLAELNRQQELLQGGADNGSMQRESDINKNSVSAQWLILKTGWENATSSMGEAIREPLLDIIFRIQSIIGSVRRWVEENKELAAMILKVVAGLAALTLAGGALSLTLASILGPIAILRFTLSTLGIRLLPNIGLFSLLKNSVKGFGNSIIWLSKSPLKMGKGAIGAFKGALNILSNPMTIIRGAISHLGSTLLWLVKSPLAMARMGVQALMIGFGLLTSPITIGIAAIIAIAAAVYKYWEPIKAFINGVIEGFKAGVKPLADLFSPLKPVFDWVIEKVKAIWQWFTDLLKPIESTKESLDSAANMGKKFGEFLAAGINIVLAPLKTLTDGVMWLLEKLGVVESKSKKLEEVKIPVQEQVKNAQQATSYAAVSGGAGYIQATSSIPSYAAMSNYSGMHDTGGHIPRGKFGIVGENGPEFVNGPANITSRIKTAQAATLAAGLATMSFADAPIHRYAKSAPSYHEQNSSQMQVNANITINAAPGQNAEQIAQEVKRQLERQMRTAKRQNLSSYRDS